jgi:hypothetical protein
LIGNGYACNNRRTVGSGVFYKVCAETCSVEIIGRDECF